MLGGKALPGAIIFRFSAVKLHRRCAPGRWFSHQTDRLAPANTLARRARVGAVRPERASYTLQRTKRERRGTFRQRCGQQGCYALGLIPECGCGLYVYSGLFCRGGAVSFLSGSAFAAVLPPLTAPSGLGVGGFSRNRSPRAFWAQNAPPPYASSRRSWAAAVAGCSRQ